MPLHFSCRVLCGGTSDPLSTLEANTSCSWISGSICWQVGFSYHVSLACNMLITCSRVVPRIVWEDVQDRHSPWSIWSDLRAGSCPDVLVGKACVLNKCFYTIPGNCPWRDKLLTYCAWRNLSLDITNPLLLRVVVTFLGSKWKWAKGSNSFEIFSQTRRSVKPNRLLIDGWSWLK